jgi:hypothetical protein
VWSRTEKIERTEVGLLGTPFSLIRPKALYRDCACPKSQVKTAVRMTTALFDTANRAHRALVSRAARIFNATRRGNGHGNHRTWSFLTASLVLNRMDSSSGWRKTTKRDACHSPRRLKGLCVVWWIAPLAFVFGLLRETPAARAQTVPDPHGLCQNNNSATPLLRGPSPTISRCEVNKRLFLPSD